MFKKILFCFIIVLVCSRLASPEVNRNKIVITPFEKKEIECLAKNIYFEARGEPEEGQIAVGLVTLNRTKQKHWPNSICEVVQQSNQSVCQFSWWCNDSLRYKAINNTFSSRETDSLNNARLIATWIYKNEVTDLTHGATFFHTTYVKPGWKNVSKTVQIGQHLFYRRKYNEAS